MEIPKPSWNTTNPDKAELSLQVVEELMGALPAADVKKESKKRKAEKKDVVTLPAPLGVSAASRKYKCSKCKRPKVSSIQPCSLS